MSSFRFLVSFSAFKGSLTNQEACEIAASALREKGHSATCLPLGDGGKGTFAFLQNDPQVEKRISLVHGAFGNEVKACSYWKKSGDKWQIFLESAEVCGYRVEEPEKRDALGASSAGLGEWLLAIQQELGSDSCELFIGLGDSAISDAGIGMLGVLGFEFFDKHRLRLRPMTTALDKIASWVHPPVFWDKWKITVLCDVKNPLCGKEGSARVFSPQKGANQDQVLRIEDGHLNFAKWIHKYLKVDIAKKPRSGSAGGLAAALHVFLGGELVSGSEFMLQASGFESLLRENDCLFVGEGKSDSQTLSGKAPWVAIEVAEKLGKKSVLISGELGEGAEKIRAKGLMSKVACGREPEPSLALRNAVLEVAPS